MKTIQSLFLACVMLVFQGTVRGEVLWPAGPDGRGMAVVGGGNGALQLQPPHFEVDGEYVALDDINPQNLRTATGKIYLEGRAGDGEVRLQWRMVAPKVAEEFLSAGQSAAAMPVDELLGKVTLMGRAPDQSTPTEREVGEVKGFLLFYGPYPGPYSERLVLEEEQEHRVTGLENGEEYQFLVLAYDQLQRLVGSSQELRLRPETIEMARSPVERRFFEVEVDSTTTRDLKQFGYEMFARSGGAFEAPMDAMPGPDYPVGPGDVLEIFLWGQLDGDYTVTVDPDGAVRIPKVGRISLTGLTLAQATDKIRAALARQFSGFDVSVSLKSLRAIQVFVVGEVKTPGSYSVSALSTVFNGLFAAGGPTKQGSLRSIDLRRADGSNEVIDLYDFLMNGDRSGDLRLTHGDTVFVPLVGETVGVTGQVKRPAIYELRPEESLRDALTFAGGITAHADPRTVQIERVEGQLRRVVKRVSWEEAMAGEWEVRSGDLASVRSIYPQVEGRVELGGEVKQPGTYPWHPGLRLSALLSDRSQFLPGAFLEYGEVRRVDGETLRETILSFSPGGLLAGNSADDLVLVDRDVVKVFSEEELARQEFVEVRGEIATPGRYPYVPGMRIRDLIYQAGNLTGAAYLPEGEVTRLLVSGDGTTTERIYFSVQAALADRGDHNLPLLPNDQLYVRAVPDWSVERVVGVIGEVRFPGSYAFRRGERVSEVLERAGGFTPHGFLRGAVFTRESVREIQQERLQAFVQEQEAEFLRQSAEAAKATLDSGSIAALERALEDKRRLLQRLRTTQVKGRMVVRILPLDELRSSSFDLELEAGDTLTIPPIPSSVTVLGRVYNPTSLIYEDGKPVGYYLAQTGGAREDADEEHLYLVRADGTVISRAQERGLTWWWSRGQKRWFPGRFEGLTVERGDTLLVPEKPIVVGKLAIARDITQILANIAVSAGNLKFLFSR